MAAAINEYDELLNVSMELKFIEKSFGWSLKLPPFKWYLQEEIQLPAD